MGCWTTDSPSPPVPIHPERILWLPGEPKIQDTSYGSVDVKDGRSIFADGSANVGFSATGSREELSPSIVQHFAEAGWIRRETQYLNPQFETSFRRGWRRQCACVIPTDLQARPVPVEPYFEWEGEWQDREGNIAVYDLASIGPSLRGFASFVPKILVEEAQQRSGGDERR